MEKARAEWDPIFEEADWSRTNEICPYNSCGRVLGSMSSMPPEDEDVFAAGIAAQLASMSEEDRIRTKRFVELAFGKLCEFELRVRRLEMRDASGKGASGN